MTVGMWRALPGVLWVWLSVAFAPLAGAAGDANRLTYLDEFCDPYYAHTHFPRLTTPQWVGEPGVDAVVVLAIDDMRDSGHYEAYLRPILERLKQIDGRAPVSIMTNAIDPADPQLQIWLKEGLSIETHTADHPCPCLQKGDFAAAKGTYDRCVDSLAAIPGSHPVAFRFPCMDSLNTPSPRAFAEILNQTTAQGNFLQISSSVVTVFTDHDPELPRELVIDADGAPRMMKYLPFPSFVNKVENYPYPFVVGRLIWEFPCSVPDDWQGFNLHGPFNPKTVADWQAAVDATVLKQGVANFVFHPHNWIRNTQMVEIIDRVVERHSERVKFLTFRESLQRIDEHLLAGQPLRAADGGDNGVRLLDLNDDGCLDVVIGNDQLRRTRLWQPDEKQWLESDFPAPLVTVGVNGQRQATGGRFGVLDGHVIFLVQDEQHAGAWRWEGQGWKADDALLAGLSIEGEPVRTARDGRDAGVRLRDIDADGHCELLAAGPARPSVFRWNQGDGRWQPLPTTLPPGTSVVDAQARDAGLRFVDVNQDGFDDVLFSNEQRYSLHLYDPRTGAWSHEVSVGQRDEGNAIPMISRSGTNNGAWFAGGHLWVQNEDTARLPDGVDRRSFEDLLEGEK